MHVLFPGRPTAAVLLRTGHTAQKEKARAPGKVLHLHYFYPDGNLIKEAPVLNVGGHCYVGIHYVQSRYAQAAVLQS